MHSPDKIHNYIEQLKEASIQAMDAGEFSRGVDLANAVKSLQEWLDDDLSGEMPADPIMLLQGEIAESALAQPAPPEDWRRQVEELKAPLRTVRKDLRQVEEARLRASELLRGEVISGLDLRRDLEDVYQKLDELRDEILRASEGAAASHRAEDFERAIEIYRNALRRGYDVIVDDTTGEPIDVVEALEHTLHAYWTDLQVRASRRYNEAQKALEDGYTETAVMLLEEAQDLLKRVEEGGEAARQQLDQALARTRETLKNKQTAQRLVAEAEAAADPEQGHRKLIEAKQYYPDYPGIDNTIKAREKLVSARVVRDIGAHLSEARGMLGGRDPDRFEKARGLCRTALRRGAHLSTTSDKLERRHQEAEVLLEVIGQREQAHRDLAAKLDRIDQALEAEDIRLATKLLNWLEQDEQASFQVAERRERLSFLKADNEKFADAERLFYEGGDLRQAIALCESLVSSPVFRERARILRRRAEARLWLTEAESAYREGNLDRAIEVYQRIARLETELPAADQIPVQQAREAEGRLRQKKER